MATTCITEQAKLDMFNGGLCLQTTQSGVACTCSSTVNMTGLASTAGLAVGMAVTGTNAGAGGVISKIVSNTALTLSVASTGALTSATFTADVCLIALIKVGPGGTYDQTLLNYGIGSGTPGAVNVGTDEITGTGYSAGGFTLTNVTAVLSSTTAVSSFSVNPSWTTATFSTIAGVIYNSTARIGSANAATASLAGINNHTISIHDFAGTQTVSAGTFTLIVPTANSSTGLLRIA